MRRKRVRGRGGAQAAEPSHGRRKRARCRRRVDRSLLCVRTVQVVSRAHRMGAKQPVHVEVLAMAHTAEQVRGGWRLRGSCGCQRSPAC